MLKEHESHEKESGATPDVLHRSYTYDVRHRLTSERNKLNDSEETKIEHIYNDLGQSVEKHYRCGDSVYTEKSSYTLQGWLKTLSGPYYSQTLRYYDPTQPGIVPSFNGNISEWEWSHGGSTVGYGYGYDHSNRLSQAVYSLKSNNSWTRTDQFTVKDIHYDLNGNLRGLIRHHNSATDVKSLDYIYAGPHLRQLKENGSFRSYYQYDKNGNVKCDGRNNCYFEYNYLNLLSREGSYNTFAYSSSGEKLSLLDEYRNGRMYLGSLSYTKSNKELLLEGAQFSDGMIMRNWNGGYDTHLYFRDHLGSVRVVLNTANNRILERNDYYPFGLRHSNSQTPVSGNRFRYNGKERHSFGGNDYHDYGARMYDPYSGRWLGVDPLADHPKQIGTSSYAFVNNNPLRYIDPTGMIWEDPKQAERLNKSLENRIESIVKSSEKIQSQIDKGGLSDKRLAKFENKLAENSQQVELLNQSIADVKAIENATEIYKLTGPSASDGTHGVIRGIDGVIKIEGSNTGLHIHEIRHVGQSIEAGGVRFNKDGKLLNAATTLRGARKNEVNAYKTQYSFDGTYPAGARSLKDINETTLMNIKTSDGRIVYEKLKKQ
ncbi:hypothetical protein LJB85_04100 [Porphyromonadaceae bacterium OttesenSCG-928-L07]|nr:hypothetical protein [Porphyromonadaceae bacterium OttesenSCG-928-L07]